MSYLRLFYLTLITAFTDGHQLAQAIGTFNISNLVQFYLAGLNFEK